MKWHDLTINYFDDCMWMFLKLKLPELRLATHQIHLNQQSRSQKLLLGGYFGQNRELFGKIVDLFYKTVHLLLNEIEDVFSKIITF